MLIVGISSGYVQCSDESCQLVLRRKVPCDMDSCRKVAKHQGWIAGRGNWAFCDDHVGSR